MRGLALIGWHCVEINNESYLCGFMDVGPTFEVYVGDMENVWRHSPSEEDIREKAALASISDFDSERYSYLIGCFRAAFAEPQKNLTFELRDSTMRIETIISDGLTWVFCLKKCLLSESTFFYRDLCLLSFGGYSFLQYKARKLQEMVQTQLKYALYLEENYKTINGTELIDKYRRQHPAEAKYLGGPLMENLLEDWSSEYLKNSLLEISPLGVVDCLLNGRKFLFHNQSLKRKEENRSVKEENESITKEVASIKEEKTSIKKEVASIKREENPTIKGINGPLLVGSIIRKRPNLEDQGEVETRKKIKQEDSFYGSPSIPPSSPTRQDSSSPVRLVGSSPRRRRIGKIGRR